MAQLDTTLEILSQRTGSSAGALETVQERIQFQDAVRIDIAAIVGQLNAVYNPLVDTLSKVVGLDALDFGLSGNIIFAHANATEADASLYYDTTTARARTVKESFDVVLSEVSRLENLINNNASLVAYDDTAVVATGALNAINLTQLRLDSMGDNYTLDSDGAPNLTYSLSQHIDALGAFFSGFPGTGNTYTPVYPAVALAVNVSDLNFDTTIAISNITNLSAGLSNIQSFVGMSSPGDGNPTYSSTNVVVQSSSLETAIGALDAVIAGGPAFTTTSNVTSNSIGTLATDDFVFGSSSLEDDADVNHDSRFLFDKSKSAFRAGSATGSQWNNSNRGNHSVAFGQDTQASGSHAVALGGEKCLANADYSTVSGLSATSTHFGGKAHSSGVFSIAGDAQAETAIWRNQTTDASVTQLYLDGVSLLYSLDDTCTYVFDVLIVGRQTGGAAGTAGDSFYEEFKGAVEMTGGVPTGVAGGTQNTVSNSAGAAAWVVSGGIDDVNDAFIIAVTGEANKDINWVATARIIKVLG